MKETIIDVAEMQISSAGDEVFVAPSLGSCVAISLYDPGICTGGLLIFMLPKMTDVSFPGAEQFTFMFGDTGIPAFLKAALAYGMIKERLQVTLAGGGQIVGQNESFNIGQRNSHIARELITATGLDIQNQSLGGIFNRTLQMELADGKIQISNAGQKVQTE
jgi:chemotaxis protein CheD